MRVTDPQMAEGRRWRRRAWFSRAWSIGGLIVAALLLAMGSSDISGVLPAADPGQHAIAPAATVVESSTPSQEMEHATRLSVASSVALSVGSSPVLSVATMDPTIPTVHRAESLATPTATRSATRQPVRTFPIRTYAGRAVGPVAVTPVAAVGLPTVTPTPRVGELTAPEAQPEATAELRTADGQLVTAPGQTPVQDAENEEAASTDTASILENGAENFGAIPAFAPTNLELAGRYTVQEGDTLWGVSIEMGLDLVDTVCAVSPDFALDRPLVVGDILSAPPIGTACHRVEAGETPQAIAEVYGVAAESITAEPWNRLGAVEIDAPLVPDTYVRVPVGSQAATSGAGAGQLDGFLEFMLTQPVTDSPHVTYARGGPETQPPRSSVPANWPYGSGDFAWPVYGWLSNGYRLDHRAIDIAAQPGSFVTAADRGVVIRAGWNDQGYGRFVVVDHNIDYVTLYAHLDQVLVAEGDVVGQGEILGTVGSTGNSTGPHLHFEIRDFGRRANPIVYLLR